MLNPSQTPDLINAAFELLGGVFVLGHCRAIRRDKAVKGVSIPAVVFFTAWGGWNLYYYPHLGQWLSFAGGVALVAANLLYVGLLVYYRSPRYGLAGIDEKPAQSLMGQYRQTSPGVIRLADAKEQKGE